MKPAHGLYLSGLAHGRESRLKRCRQFLMLLLAALQLILAAAVTESLLPQGNFCFQSRSRRERLPGSCFWLQQTPILRACWLLRRLT